MEIKINTEARIAFLSQNLGVLGWNPDMSIMLPCFQTRLDWITS